MVAEAGEGPSLVLFWRRAGAQASTPESSPPGNNLAGHGGSPCRSVPCSRPSASRPPPAALVRHTRLPDRAARTTISAASAMTAPLSAH